MCNYHIEKNTTWSLLWFIEFFFILFKKKTNFMCLKISTKNKLHEDTYINTHFIFLYFK